MPQDIKIVKYGNHERKSFSKTKEVLPLPNLIEVQKSSYKMFIDQGIQEVFEDFSPIEDFAGHFRLEFLDHRIDATPKYSEAECRLRDATYAAPLRLNVRLINKGTGEFVDQEVFMGDFPLMTNTGSFIINGAERVIVSQLVRSPGVYCDVQLDKNGKPFYNTTAMPSRGAWLEIEHDSNNNVLNVHIDRNRKLPITVLLRGILHDGMNKSGSGNYIAKLLEYDPVIALTYVKDDTATDQESLVEIYRRLRPGEIPTDESVQKTLNDLLFDAHRYDLARVGRYKYNKKLALATRIKGLTLGRDVEVSLLTFAKYTCLTKEQAEQIAKSGVVRSIKILNENGQTVDVAVYDKKSFYDSVVGAYLDAAVTVPAKRVIAAGTRLTASDAYDIQHSGINEIYTNEQTYTEIFNAKKAKTAHDYEQILSKHLGSVIMTEKGVLEMFDETIDASGRVLTELPKTTYEEKKGEILVSEAAQIAFENGYNLYKSNTAGVIAFATECPLVKVIGNRTVDAHDFAMAHDTRFAEIDYKALGLYEAVDSEVLREILSSELSLDDTAAVIKSRRDELISKHITRADIIATVNYNLGMKYGIGVADDIDHLGNRRVRSIGELLQNQFRIGISRLERVIRERMAIQEPGKATPQTLINVRPVSSAIKEFFGSSQLSQFMDQSNPIAELTHKRKLSALGPGGLNRDRATFEVRDVHYTHYGRMCPIETPEGQNIGLITSLAGYARINEYGFIEAPYRRVDKIHNKVTDTVEYLSADEEDKYIIGQANEPLNDDGYFARERITCRRREEILEFPREKVDYIDVSPRQLISVATSLIPFLENDDTNRALMGSNMQRQAVPLISPEAPIVATGIEARIAYDSGVMVIAEEAGTVLRATDNKIVVQGDNGALQEYILKKFVRSNQGTCINQKIIVKVGEHVEKGQVLADGPSTDGGELALGRNMMIGFMTWEGYNYEDAVLLSERLVKEDAFTSIHIEEHEIESRETKLGPEEFTRDIPNVGEDALKDLDEDGIIRIGAEVHPGDILVGKVTPKGETDLTPEERLLRAIFSEKAREVRDTSLRVPNGEGGIVVDVKVFTRENKDELDPGVSKLVRVYIAQKRKISVGDKMAGRHGNKGVVSRILPEEDMPFMEDGTPLQIVLNPLGVPSRMNIGQVLEVHLGLISKMLGWNIATPVFDGASEEEIRRLFEENGMVNPVTGKVDGKVQLYDGRTGEPFENRVTVGYMYYLKLVHLVDDKIHARSTGPYSLVTQQPLGGKAQFGGQRFGEMEVWALEAYGAANVLQEILTVKSDDVVGRVKTYEAIVKGENIPDPGIPESFKVLIKELQSLALDVKVLSADKEEIIVRDSTDDEADYNEIMQAEREDRKAAMHDFNEEDEIALEGVGEQHGFTDDDDDFSLDSLFDDEEDTLGDLFSDGEKEETDFEDEENLDDDGLDSLLDALNGDSDDDEEDDIDDIDDLFGDDDDKE
ncbi:MAG: DNA-directed RNA polymerase subunit beta [Clostridiales bacterium]|nr:DNA-directed RNA polymerase subunit beta [Clostridiales bacterium]